MRTSHTCPGLLILLFLSVVTNASVNVDEWKDGLWLEEAKRQGAICSNGCSHHGRCGPAGECVCDELWGGEDCSIPVRSLAPGQAISSVVEGGSWQFFETATLVGQTVKWTVNSSSGDCDLYVRHQQIPTRNLYDERDIGLAMSFFVEVVNENSRKWYAGVHGFMQSNYTIAVSLSGGSGGGSSNCPSGCSGHGTCLNNHCECRDSWAGLDCSISIKKLSLGHTASDIVSQGTWKYYSYILVGERFLTVQFNETLTGGDADLFIKFGGLPNHTYFDYRDVSIAPMVKLDVEPPLTLTTMYVGIYGFNPSTSYRLLLLRETSCPSECSRHGQCVGASMCRCSSQFSGSLCETMNQPLAANEAVDGYVADGVWNYYHFASNSLTAVVIEVDQEDSDPTADCDVYVRAGSIPTQGNYDYADLSYARQMRIAIPEPQFNTWYIGVYGSKRCAYQIRQSMTSSCIEGCAPPYGICTPENTCRCYPTWAGEDCRTPVTPLSADLTAEGSLRPNQFKYYSFNVSSEVATVSLLEVDSWSTGYYWLFVGVDSVPDRESFDYSDTETNTPYHQLDLSLGASQEQPITLYIGVYGSPYDLAGPNHPPAHFKLAAWRSPF